MEEKTYMGYSFSERIRWIVAFGLIAVLLIGMAVSFSLILSLKKEEIRPQNDFAAETVNSEHLRLTMSTYAAVAADNSVRLRTSRWTGLWSGAMKKPWATCRSM